MVPRGAISLGTLPVIIGLAAAKIPLRDDMGNMSMTISTSVPDAQRYFNQGLRFMSTFKFDYAAESQREALLLDPDCAMCEWGLGLAYGQNINDALVMALEPEFLSNEPLAYEAVSRAQALLGADGASGDDSPMHARDSALASAFSLKLVPTVKEYESHFVDGLPASLSLAYAEAMAEAASRSEEEGWPDRAMVLLLAADAWMNISPWDYWETPKIMRTSGKKARQLLENSLSLDPYNAWAIHLYIHLMEAGSEARLAVAPGKRLEYLVPGAPHLQHMQSHVEFRTGQWHEASEANLRAVALPDSDASYPEHNMDMLMWSLGVEGRQTESNVIGRRLTAHATPRALSAVMAPLAPPERFLSQEALHLVAFADWEGIMALDPPPDTADYPVSVHHFARSLAFVEAQDWDSYRREQGLITSSMERIEGKSDFYGVFNAPTLTKIIDLISRAEGLRGGICSADGGTSTPDSSSADAFSDENDPAHRGLFALPGLGAGIATHDARRSILGRDSVALGCPTAADTSAVGVAAAARQEEITLLWQAAELEDSLGYDEPPPLPLPARLFLGAALLRGAPGSDLASTVDVVEAEAVFREIENRYPSMPRTLLGLWRACSALGKKDEAQELRKRYVASCRYSEIVLGDSAHVKGQINVGHDVVVVDDNDIDGKAGTSELAGREGTATGSTQSRSWMNGWAGTVAVLTLIATLSLAVLAARSTMVRERWRRRYRGVHTGPDEARRGDRGQPGTAETDPLAA